MFTFLLMVLMLPNQDTVNLHKGVVLSRQGEFEESEEIFKGIKSDDPQYTFYRLVNNYSLNRKEEATKWADSLIYAFSGQQIPIRYYDMAVLMKAEMESWKHDDADLEDIAREMDRITKRLQNHRGGPKTQEIQQQVSQRLDRIIKKMEEEVAAKAKAQADAEQKDREELQRRAGILPPPEAPRGMEKGTGQVDIRKIKEIAAVWGNLPQKERAKAMLELLRGLPQHDRAVVESYFRELQKNKK